MPKPDVEPPNEHGEGRIFYNGKVWNYASIGGKMVLMRYNPLEPLYSGDSINDCTAWLMAQQMA